MPHAIVLSELGASACMSFVSACMPKCADAFVRGCCASGHANFGINFSGLVLEWLPSSSPGHLDPGRSRALLSPVWFSRRLEQRMEEGGGSPCFCCCELHSDRMRVLLGSIIT